MVSRPEDGDAEGGGVSRGRQEGRIGESQVARIDAPQGSSVAGRSREVRSREILYFI